MRSYDPTRIDIHTDPTTRRMRGTTVHGHKSFDVPFMSQIMSDLWMGGCAVDLVLPRNIEHVVSLYPWESYEVNHELRSSLTVRMYDANERPDVREVHALASWVNTARLTGEVLVHCQAGLNRSGLIVGASLILDGMSADVAIDLLRTKRSDAVLCNQAFADFLASYHYDYLERMP